MWIRVNRSQSMLKTHARRLEIERECGCQAERGVFAGPDLCAGRWDRRSPERPGARARQFAARKAHLVLYLVGGFEDRHQKLMAKLGPHKTGKGCLYLKTLADVDLDVLRELVDRSVRVRRGVDRASGAPQAP